MYQRNPTVFQPEIKLPVGKSDKKIVALESKINALEDRLARVLKENEQLQRDIKRNAQDIQLLTNAVARRK